MVNPEPRLPEFCVDFFTGELLKRDGDFTMLFPGLEE